MTLPWIYIDELQRKLDKNTLEVTAHVLKLAKPKQNMTRLECGHSLMRITNYQTNIFIMSSSSDQLQ
jgi:energy-coupling factor transporter ATP-binding protein EcfA2